MDTFLAEIDLAQHATILDKLGYDNPNDFAEFEANDLEKLETRCTDQGMPPAHVDKIIRSVKKQSAVAAAAATTSVTPAPAPALVCTWGVMSAPGDRREVVMPQVGPTWGCEIFCESPVRPHPPPCAG